jgi:hypothetical protein
MSYTPPEKGDLESGQPLATHISQAPRGYANGIDTIAGAPLDRTQTVMMPAFGGAFQPAPYKPSFRKFANPAPLGLCAFALTTFILSLINANTRGVKVPGVVVGSAYAYGGVIQLLAGMWEMAVGSETPSFVWCIAPANPVQILLVLLLCPRTVVSGSPGR